MSVVKKVATAINGCDCELCQSKARAAIEAMREPTEEMVDEGIRALGAPLTAARRLLMQDAHRAMIDAALTPDFGCALHRRVGP